MFLWRSSSSCIASANLNFLDSLVYRAPEARADHAGFEKGEKGKAREQQMVEVELIEQVCPSVYTFPVSNSPLRMTFNKGQFKLL